MNKPAFPARNVILSVEEMTRADQATIGIGVASDELMERAGSGVASAIIERWTSRPTLVLCGPGKNGGDGFVLARHLRDAGWPVHVALLGSISELEGDAKLNADRWSDPIGSVNAADVTDAALVVDALFGSGLSRPIDGVAAESLMAIGDTPCIAVDIPSGVDGNTGAVLGVAAQAKLTVTFCRRKPGHVLLPGRVICGEQVVTDIGIPDSVIAELSSQQAHNDSNLWQKHFPWPRLEQHKYSRGQAVIAGGPEMTGAARMAVQSAQRIGVGLVSLVCGPESASIYRMALPSAIIKMARDTLTFVDLIETPNVTAWLIGPGIGITVQTRERVLSGLRTGKPAVLDADAISIFEDNPELLFDSIVGPCLLTPHEGEFAKLFGFAGSKLSRARQAAQLSGSVILLKGADTVIAHPDGRVVINSNAPASLATAGSGDVLAGLAVGLIAQGMEPFDAACAAAWLHGAAAEQFGPGLIAEDLIDQIPSVLRGLMVEKTLAN
jgi:ADP-dependent NAD(P)H-hydrate dehydratase / NAD(P)H-hydrate epimerase